MNDDARQAERPPEPPRALSRGRFIGEPAPDHKLHESPMDPADARLLIEEELLLDGVHPSERKRVHTGTGY